jgi:hypothetical protein
MPNGKHYYSYSGPPFEELQVLGLCCVPKPQQQWPPKSIQQHLHIEGPYDPNISERGYTDSGSTARWTFGYTLALPSIDRLFVEVDTGTTGAQDIAAIDSRVVRFLSEGLPANWGQLHVVSGPTWRPAPASAADWPPSNDVLKFLSVPSAPPIPDPVKPDIGCGALTGLALIAMFLFVMFSRGGGGTTIPDLGANSGVQFSNALSRDAQSGRGGAVPAPLQASTPLPTNATLCRGGCTNKPDVGCPSPIKGRFMADGQRWYYEPHHPRYNEFEPNMNLGERWFCVTSEAIDAGYYPAPF